MTLSNGQTFDIYVPESKGVKLASKRQNKAYRRINETEKKKTNIIPRNWDERMKETGIGE